MKEGQRGAIRRSHDRATRSRRNIGRARRIEA
jgi:hypothetical protein